MPLRTRAGSAGDRPRPLFSRFYAGVSERMEAEGMAELRDELLDGLHGAVIEVGSGNGINFRHYGPGVARVDAVEPEPRLRALAVAEAARSSLPIWVHPGRADALPLPDGSADAAVLCLVLCSLDDPPAALAELRRVLRPGGQVRFLEHTVAETPGLRAAQRIADATVWPLLAGGCHTARDPVAALTAAGFEVTGLRRLQFPPTRWRQPSSPHVLGSARSR